MAKITVMDENLANKIAAGEVIEKTMNVVKEFGCFQFEAVNKQCG